MLTTDEVRKALELDPFEGFARKRLNEPLSEVAQIASQEVEFGPRRTGRTTRMLCSVLAACSTGRIAAVYAKPMPQENAIKEKAREWAVRLGINPKLIVGSLAPADLEFFDHTYYGL